MAGLRQLFLLASLPLLALGQKSSPNNAPFQLYGYGEGFSLPLFYADGYAYLGNVTVANSTDAANVIFTADDDAEQLLGSPNTTFPANGGNRPAWSNVTWFIPEAGSSDTRVGFLDGNSTTTGAVTSGFRFYGRTVVFVDDTGSPQTLWTSLQLDDGNRALYWNDTSKGQEPVSLRSIAPTRPGNL